MNTGFVNDSCDDCGKPIKAHPGGYAALCDECKRERALERKRRYYHRSATPQTEPALTIVFGPSFDFRPGAKFDIAEFRFAKSTVLGNYLGCVFFLAGIGFQADAEVYARYESKNGNARKLQPNCNVSAPE